jgi:hypothetical protein
MGVHEAWHDDLAGGVYERGILTSLRQHRFRWTYQDDAVPSNRYRSVLDQAQVAHRGPSFWAFGRGDGEQLARVMDKQITQH